MGQLHLGSRMESFGISHKQNDGCGGKPPSVAASSRAATPAILTEKRAMKKEEKVLTTD